jgi:hypothetical protein
MAAKTSIAIKKPLSEKRPEGNRLIIEKHCTTLPETPPENILRLTQVSQQEEASRPFGGSTMQGRLRSPPARLDRSPLLKETRH